MSPAATPTSYGTSYSRSRTPCGGGTWPSQTAGRGTKCTVSRLPGRRSPCGIVRRRSWHVRRSAETPSLSGRTSLPSSSRSRRDSSGSPSRVPPGGGSGTGLRHNRTRDTRSSPSAVPRTRSSAGSGGTAGTEPSRALPRAKNGSRHASVPCPAPAMTAARGNGRMSLQARPGARRRDSPRSAPKTS